MSEEKRFCADCKKSRCGRDWRQCRAHPPLAIAEPNGRVHGIWPPVQDDDWCDEFEDDDDYFDDPCPEAKKEAKP